MEAHERAKLPRYYFDWTLMGKRQQKSFIGTMPVNMFYGLRELIRLLEDEGLPNVFARHARLAEAMRRAVKVWAGNNGPQLFCTNPSRYSDSVTAVLMPEGHDAEAVRNTARHRFNVSLGGGLGKLRGKVFRIGHLGDLNEPMVLGALSAVEMALRINNVPHGRGGVDAAMDYLAEGMATAASRTRSGRGPADRLRRPRARRHLVLGRGQEGDGGGDFVQASARRHGRLSALPRGWPACR